jgi:hypothetical protein
LIKAGADVNTTTGKVSPGKFRLPEGPLALATEKYYEAIIGALASAPTMNPGEWRRVVVLLVYPRGVFPRTMRG